MVRQMEEVFVVNQENICGESGDVQGETIDSWKEHLLEIIQGYEKHNIWNMDETGLFWHALPDRGFGKKVEVVREGRKANIDSLLLFLFQHQVKKKNLLLFGSLETPGVCDDSTNRFCQ